MELLSTPDDDREKRLTREDWVLAALQVLLKEGIEAVQITALAQALNVTRGSFYWHFKSRQRLLDAILEEWRVRNTGIMMQVLENASSVETGMLDLFSVWVDHSKFNPDLDQAVRDWGRRADDIKALVEAEDNDRIAAISDFFECHGYEEKEAFIRARVTYFTQLSYYALDVSEPMVQRMQYLETYFQCFTGRQISPEIAEDFRQRLVAWEQNK